MIQMDNDDQVIVIVPDTLDFFILSAEILRDSTVWYRKCTFRGLFKRGPNNHKKRPNSKDIYFKVVNPHA